CRTGRGPQRRWWARNCRPSTERSLTRQAEVTSDHHSLHLVRALADLEDLLVAVEPRDRELVHEAVAAVDLKRPVRDAVGELAGEELRHSRRLREVAPFVLLPGGLVDEQACRLDLGRHVDEHLLHRLEGRDGPTELLRLARVRVRKFVAALGEPDAHRGDGDTPAVEDLQELLQPRAARTEEVPFRQARSLERELARVRRAPAE